jgi:UDP-glucose 4-epimerase
MAMKKCLVTGGLGFIGSNLVDKLVEKGHQILVVDNLSTGDIKYANKRADYEILDILQQPKLAGVIEKFSPDWVFHLAALPRIQPSFEDPISHDEANVRGCLSLIESCRGRKIEALVYSSSSSVYGTPIVCPTPEDAAIAPLSPYALQKYAGERYLHIFGEKWSIPVASVRYFNVYGPRSFNLKNPFNPYTSVVGIFQNLVDQGKRLTITGDGQQERDFVHVWDVAYANICVAESIKVARDRVFNVGTGEKISILQLAKLFEKEYVFVPERPGEARITHADTRALRSLGWEVTVPLLEAIRKKIA